MSMALDSTSLTEVCRREFGAPDRIANVERARA
jgi:hypothetical protein